MEVLIIIGIVALVITLGIFGYLQALKRRKELSEWAQKNGYRFDESREYYFDNTYNQFSCLRKGSSRYAYNRIEGSRNDRGVLAFDYHYETYSNDSKGNRKTHHHYFSAVIIKTDLPLKQLFIREESFFDKISEFVGFDDIDFESSEFSKAFYVKAQDKKWAYDVIHQKTMEYLLNAPRFTLEMVGNTVIAYRSTTFSIADFENAIHVIGDILDLLPDYLIQELRGQA
jgi:hypothetical protein